MKKFAKIPTSKEQIHITIPIKVVHLLVNVQGSRNSMEMPCTIVPRVKTNTFYNINIGLSEARTRDAQLDVCPNATLSPTEPKAYSL